MQRITNCFHVFRIAQILPLTSSKRKNQLPPSPRWSQKCSTAAHARRCTIEQAPAAMVVSSVNVCRPVYIITSPARRAHLAIIRLGITLERHAHLLPASRGGLTLQQAASAQVMHVLASCQELITLAQIYSLPMLQCVVS